MFRSLEARQKEIGAPVCVHCHAVVNDPQRMHWFFRRVVLKAGTELDSDEGADDTVGLSPPVR
jgi:hypothetical protein